MYQIGDYTYSCGSEDFLGEGSYGKVFKCKSKTTNEEYCIKIISKNQNIQELEVLRILQTQECRNIVQIHDIYNQRDAIYVVMEKCDYDLYSEFKELQKRRIWYTEDDKINIMQQIINGCQFLSKQKIIHRDIKPTNILIKTVNRGTVQEEKIYKIADFGFSKLVDDINKQGNLTRYGTKIYSAPQLYFENEFSGKCDIFSYGVVFYQINYEGKLMFDVSVWNKCLKNLKYQPLKCEVKSGKYGQQVANLIERMLKYEEDDRISLEQLYKHPIISYDNQQDSIFAKINDINNREYIQWQLVYQRQSRLERIDKILQIFYRKFQYIDSLHNQNENSMISYSIAQLALQQLTYAMGMLNGSISDIHECFRKDNDIPHLLKILTEYNQQLLSIHQQLKSSIINAYFNQKSKINQKQNEIFKQLMLSAIKESFKTLFLKSLSQVIPEKSYYELLQQENSIMYQIDQISDKNLFNLEIRFPIQNYDQYSPDEIFCQ